MKNCATECEDKPFHRGIRAGLWRDGKGGYGRPGRNGSCFSQRLFIMALGRNVGVWSIFSIFRFCAAIIIIIVVIIPPTMPPPIARFAGMCFFRICKCRSTSSFADGCTAIFVLLLSKRSLVTKLYRAL